MEIKYNTKDFEETTDIYELARGVFHHFDHENVIVDYDLNIEPNSTHNVTISWSSELSYSDYVKLEILNNLITKFTSYRNKEEV